MDFEEQKERLRHNLNRLGVTDERVRETLLKVKREKFVPPEMHGQAYADRPLPIGEYQTISQPSLVAYMTQKLNLKPTDRVLEIGTGSGFQTALLAELAGEVFTIEVREKLSARAQETLRELGYTNIRFKIGDGSLGWAEAAPFDAVIVTAAASEVPGPLMAQLKHGGHMIIPTDAESDQELRLITKCSSGADVSILFPVRFVPLITPH
jgi:protein-L-isoaspartate(D-aspartate) O-methyltransferase